MRTSTFTRPLSMPSVAAMLLESVVSSDTRLARSVDPIVTTSSTTALNGVALGEASVGGGGEKNGDAVGSAVGPELGEMEGRPDGGALGSAVGGGEIGVIVVGLIESGTAVAAIVGAAVGSTEGLGEAGSVVGS